MDTSKLKETIKNIFWCILLLIFATIFSILGGSNLYNPNLHALGAGPSTYALGALVFTFIALICYSAVIAFLSEIITGFILKGNNNIPTIMWIITFVLLIVQGIFGFTWVWILGIIIIIFICLVVFEYWKQKDGYLSNE